MKDPKNVARGKKSRKSGADFERRVRKDLESGGWVVSKWMNNFSDYPDSNINLPPEEREDRKLIPAKHKFRGKGIPMAIGTGFPDFIAFRNQVALDLYEIIGVECKTNGYLDKEERAKCKWLLENNIFSKILIASKKTDGRKILIKYDEFKRDN